MKNFLIGCIMTSALFLSILNLKKELQKDYTLKVINEEIIVINPQTNDTIYKSMLVDNELSENLIKDNPELLKLYIRK